MQIQLLPASIKHEKDAGLATKSTFQESFLWPDIGVNPTMPHFFSRIMKGVPKNKAGPRKDEGMVLEPGLHKHIKICHAFSFPSNEYETILAILKWFTPNQMGLRHLELPSVSNMGGAPVFFGDPEKMRFEDEQVRRHWHPWIHWWSQWTLDGWQVSKSGDVGKNKGGFQATQNEDFQ